MVKEFCPRNADPTERKVFTVGFVAQLCQVAPRTVTKWYDNGNLKGFRISMTGDTACGARRIYRDSLIEFLRKQGMVKELNSLQPDRPVLVAGYEIRHPGVYNLRSLFRLGVAIERRNPRIIIIDASLGRADVIDAGKSVRELFSEDITLVGLMSEDDVRPSDWTRVGFNTVLRHPVFTEELKGVLDGHSEVHEVECQPASV